MNRIDPRVSTWPATMAFAKVKVMDKGMRRVRQVMEEGKNPLLKGEVHFVQICFRILGTSDKEKIDSIGRKSLKGGRGNVQTTISMIRRLLDALGKEVQSCRRESSGPSLITLNRDKLYGPTCILQHLEVSVKGTRDAIIDGFAMGFKISKFNLENSMEDFRATLKRPTRIGGPIEDAFWTFIDQKWKNSLNVAAAEPAGWDQGDSFSRGAGATRKEDQDRQGVKKAPAAGVYVALARWRSGDLLPASEEMSVHRRGWVRRLTPPIAVQGFRGQDAGGRGKIIRDNRLCPFCLRHDVDEVCYSKVNKKKPICKGAICKGQHIKWLHEMLKEVPRERGKAEGRVNVV